MLACLKCLAFLLRFKGTPEAQEFAKLRKYVEERNGVQLLKERKTVESYATRVLHDFEAVDSKRFEGDEDYLSHRADAVSAAYDKMSEAVPAVGEVFALKRLLQRQKLPSFNAKSLDDLGGAQFHGRLREADFLIEKAGHIWTFYYDLQGDDQMICNVTLTGSRVISGTEICATTDGRVRRAWWVGGPLSPQYFQDEYGAKTGPLKNAELQKSRRGKRTHWEKFKITLDSRKHLRDIKKGRFLESIDMFYGKHFQNLSEKFSQKFRRKNPPTEMMTELELMLKIMAILAFILAVW